MVEVELKAWVDNKEAVKKALDMNARYEFLYTKEDSYLFPTEMKPAFPAAGVRVRKESKRGCKDIQTDIIVTYKTNEKREDVEINIEHEFIAAGKDSESALEGLFSIMGLKPRYTKKKEGISYRKDDITAELSAVENLGIFIELEILIKSSDAAPVEAAKQKLLDFLQTLGIGSEKIEMKYYSELLRERGFV